MKLVWTLFFVMMVSLGYSQSSVLRYTDYNMAQPLINPAAMGLETGVNGMLLYRSRFEKAEFWPSTGAFNINSLIPNKNLGGGLSMIFDKYGPYQKLFVYLSGSYRLKVNEGKWLYFGLQAGINYVTNSNDYVVHDEETIFTDNYSQPNFGFGLHFKADHFFAGVSVPEFRFNSIDENGERISETISEMMKIYVYGGMKFKVGKNAHLMPYLYLTYCEYEDLVMDLGGKVRFRDAFEFGLQYRTKQSFAALVRVKLFEELWLGYGFEGNNSKVDSKFNSTQEIGLTFRFGKKGKKSSSSEESFDENINSIRYF